MVVQANTIRIITQNLLNKAELPAEYNTLALEWIIKNHDMLLGSTYANFWVLEKNTSAASNYRLHCGARVQWTSALPLNFPSFIFVFENVEFKGILIGDIINQLCAFGPYGMMSWLAAPAPAPAPAPAAGGVVVRNGNNFLQLPAGGTFQVLHHAPNQVVLPGNISHFRVVRRYI